MNTIQNYGKTGMMKQNVNPSFGQIKMSSQVKRIFQDKIKTEKGWTMLDSLIKSQEKNPVPIEIEHEYNKKHKLFLSTKLGTFEQYEKYGLDGDTRYDSVPIDSIFFNPLRYLKKLCKIADKKEQSLTEFNDILKNVECK